MHTCIYVIIFLLGTEEENARSKRAGRSYVPARMYRHGRAPTGCAPYNYTITGAPYRHGRIQSMQSGPLILSLKNQQTNYELLKKILCCIHFPTLYIPNIFILSILVGILTIFRLPVSCQWEFWRGNLELTFSVH